MSPLEEWKELDEGVPEDEEFPRYVDEAAIQRNVGLLNIEPNWGNLETWGSLRRRYPIIKLPPSQWSPETERYEGGWRQILAGGTAIHDSLPNDASYPTLPPTLSPEICDPYAMGTYARYNTGVDLKKLAAEKPFEHYKFYPSFNLPTDEKKSRAHAFILELLNECKARKISITSKPHDHNYDSFNIYTWHRDAMVGILRHLYQKYTDLFLSVPRVFQGEISGVNPEHIGWVQEPVNGWNGSHSARMAGIGEYLDSLDPKGGKVQREDFIVACRKVGVRPDAPWLLKFNTEKYVRSL